MVLLSIILFLNGSFLVTLNKKHLLSVFIGLELMMLGVLLMVSVSSFFSVWVIFLIICLAVCEASVSLALLVMMVRLIGSDLVSSISLYELS